MTALLVGLFVGGLFMGFLAGWAAHEAAHSRGAVRWVEVSLHADREGGEGADSELQVRQWPPAREEQGAA
jgi:hypothetical protein